MSHQAAIQANIKAFNSAAKYDARESMQLLSILNAKTVLTSESNFQTYGEDSHKPLSGITTDIIDKSLVSNEFSKPLKVMDFACGTGLVSEVLIPYLAQGSELVGVDINPEFLSAFDDKLECKIKKDVSITVSTELVDVLDDSKEEFIAEHFTNQFDLIFCAILYHHLDNYEEVTKKLATFLKPGHGVLHIIDFYNQDVELTSPSLSPSSSPANEAVRHMGGLKVSALTETCRAAGLTDIIVKKAYDVKFWQQSGFIKNHCDQQTISSLENGTLEKKESIEGEVFLITQTVIMASGRSQ